MKSFTECFASFGAKLPNPQWAVSALAEDGALVISCWSLYFDRPDAGTLRYRDRLSRWAGNESGNRLLKEHLAQAVASSLPVRLVVATPVSREQIDAGRDASAVRKKFHTKPEVTGRVVDFDGDSFVIDFQRISE
ncbi:hypothetical protein SAMN04487939_1182 [Lysobacter sp. yr284]|uniref:hypothetical protein n=1 Tax=Lysobacter TaxID=68 RepID=UPI0008950555|nr:hypothetical protein [Lysobacter sp. yr284]SDZ14035.1 hypothetical protein SAMN04487939_1182 [Lysobacter sp. yr284]